MLRLTALIVTLLLFISISAASTGASSKGQNSHKNQPAPTVHQESNQQQQGTDKSPLVIKLNNTGESDEERKDKADAIKTQEKIEGRLTNANIALVLVAAFTAFIGIWQGYQLGRTVNTSIRIERPYIWP